MPRAECMEKGADLRREKGAKEQQSTGQMKRWMQALGLVCLLLFVPLTRETGAAEADGGAYGTEGEQGTQDEQELPGPMIAITFDDGPDARYTPKLLDGLKERNVQATFFVIGENIEKEGNDEIIRRIHEEGHLIGNHTYHHVDLSNLSVEEAHRELDMTDCLINEITGVQTELIRPPFGAFPDRMEEELDKIYVKWTVDPLDWTTEDTEEIVHRVVSDTEQNDIILLHDCYESSVEAALQIIDILKAQGYDFVTADHLIID